MPARIVSTAPRPPRDPARRGGGRPNRVVITAAAVAGLLVVAFVGWAAWSLRPGQTRDPRPASALADPVEGPVVSRSSPERVAERVLRAYTAAGVRTSATAALRLVLERDVYADARGRLRADAARNLRITRKVSDGWLTAAGQREPLALMAVLASRSQLPGDGTAVVDGYDVQVAGVEGHRAQATWRSWRVRLAQQDGRWLVTGMRSRRGPAPQSTSLAADADGRLVAELRTMTGGAP